MKSKYSAEKKSGSGPVSHKISGKNFEKDVSDKSAWRCDNCGEIHYGDEPPQECPYCLYPNKPFKKVLSSDE